MNIKRIFLAFACLPMIATAQENLSYQLPPQEILQLVDYERAPSVSMNTAKTYMILSYRNTYKTLDDLNQEELRLGGLRINPDHQISSTVTYINNLKVKKIGGKDEIQVKGLPAQARITNMIWSPNEEKMAFTNTGANGLELWILDIANAEAKMIKTLRLNANLGNPIVWFKDSESLLIRCVPNNTVTLINAQKNIPKGPIVSVSDGSVSQNRTYQDLLKNKTDEYNFEQITTTELFKVSLNGQVSLFKAKGMYSGLSFSPDGKYLLLTTIEQPFSYLVPLSRFPSKAAVYDISGKLVKQVNSLPLAEIMPKGFMAVRKGKRSMGWRADKPANLVYVEALDNGDPAEKVTHRDAVYDWAAPFSAQPELLVKTEQRFGGIIWGDDQRAIITDQWYDTRSLRTYLFNPSQKGSTPKMISDRNYQDIYSDPGEFETRKNQYGSYVLAIDNNQAYLIGEGHTKQGQFPFVDKLDLNTLKTTRWYQSKEQHKKEDISTLVDYKKGTALVMLQSATEYPNYYFRNLNTGKLTPITQFQNPFSSLNGVHKEVIKYNRKDGVALSGTLYLPARYNKKDKLPLLIWAYPAEYKDKNSAGQSTHNPNEFTFPYYGSFVYWVSRGYAVLDDAAFPIVGEGDTEPNDNFIEQLVMSAEAAIDAVDAKGYIDRKRVGVGGHSYGAFMTANLLTHSNLFACGIARSGAYNRTLTPFGFQSEQRNFWEAQKVYNTMSPFMNAEKMKTPMLLVHGDADNNPGTFTLQTERYFQALKGLGAPVRMVLLPKESHSYVAKDNIFHLLWEQDQFLEKHLKNKK